MTKEHYQLIKTLLELYQEYLDNSVEERKVELHNFDEKSENYLKKERFFFKGDLSGFMDYLANKIVKDKKPII